MRPDQLGDYLVPSDPRMHPDGVRAAFVVTRIDVEEDRYARRIWLWDGESARPLTAGPGDSSPRWSPDGATLAFLRLDDSDKAQVALLPVTAGEAETVTDFDLGATELAWSPDGHRLAVIVTEWVPEWADLDDDARASKPRRISRVPFRFDSAGWLHDRRSHIWMVDPARRTEPAALTMGDFNENEIAWSPDGSTIAFTSARHDTRGFDPGIQAWEVPASGGEAAAVTDIGLWSLPNYDIEGRLHLIGTPDRWDFPSVLRLWRRDDDGTLTPLVGDIDRDLVPFTPRIAPAGPQWLEDGSALSTLEDEGRVRIIRISSAGTVSDLIGGDRVITGISPRRDGTAAIFCATAATDPGEVWWWDGESESRITALNDEFRAETHLAEPQRFVIEHEEGVSVEGWVYLPPGDDQVPLLLSIHGGPATQYGYGFFDEFQVYVGAGYGVVATNPRGSSGYGRAHLRSVVGSWHEPLPPDLRDLLATPAAAAEAFPRLDLDRAGVMGGSYGGFATVRVLSEDERFRSAVAERGLYVFSSFGGTADIGGWFGSAYLGRGTHDDWETLWQASPIANAHRITTPTLVLHSESDWRCPIEQAEQLFSLLLRGGIETELVRFPADSSHELTRSGKPKLRVERFNIILEWHERHLGAARRG